MSADSEQLLSSAEQHYDARIGVYASFTNSLERLLEDALDREGVTYDAVTSRVKTRDSFLAKVVRPRSRASQELKYQSPEDVQDLAGLRVTTYLLKDVAQIQRVIEAEFATTGPVVRQQDDETVPGYQSVHYLVGLSPAREGLPENRNFNGLQAELQLRTVLQHAWAQAQHGILYKGEAEVPGGIRRRLVALAGLLELADNEFRAVSAELERLRELRSEETEASIADTLINRFSLGSLLGREIGSVDDASHDVWLDEFRTVLHELGVTQTTVLEGIVAGQRHHLPRLRELLTIDELEPTPVELLDGLLRLGLQGAYLERRAGFALLTAEQQTQSRHALQDLIHGVGA